MQGLWYSSPNPVRVESESIMHSYTKKKKYLNTVAENLIVLKTNKQKPFMSCYWCVCIYSHTFTLTKDLQRCDFKLDSLMHLHSYTTISHDYRQSTAQYTLCINSKTQSGH